MSAEELASLLRQVGAGPANVTLRLRGLRALRPKEVPDTASTWITCGVPELARSKGRWYHEVQLQGRFHHPQLGWLTTDFTEGDMNGSGVGDDAEGWAFDGERQKRWHAAEGQQAGRREQQTSKHPRSTLKQLQKRAMREPCRQPWPRGALAMCLAGAPADRDWLPEVYVLALYCNPQSEAPMHSLQPSASLETGGFALDLDRGTMHLSHQGTWHSEASAGLKGGCEALAS